MVERSVLWEQDTEKRSVAGKEEENMATTRIVLDSEQVLSIASQIETDNNELQQLLNESKATIDNIEEGLTHNWGENHQK